ncbi:conserved hypothetical protein [Ricinus communis]|uniref:O-methyltransferase domain-containing protein n=1 Tax=Ricinus communis TaxID=3988 RepID=B9RVR8_RICCO|nr:conserved hypothetical protein [Ricinus communis]
MKCCKEAIPRKDKGGKLIVIDLVLENQNEDKAAARAQLSLDMLMNGDYCF